MSDAVDREQEALRLIAENEDLLNALEHVIKERDHLEEKAKAWDDLEALVNLCRDSEFGLSVDQYSQEPNQVTIDKGEIDCYFYSSDLKVSVSNALKSIKGES